MARPLASSCHDQENERDQMTGAERHDLLDWLVAEFATYEFDVVAVFKRSGDHPWPIEAADPGDLEAKLAKGDHLLPLPMEPAALANVIEVSVVDFMIERIAALAGGEAQRGTERGYPDLEVTGDAFGGGFHAVDVKVARRNRAGTRTQSRITLYTGNTYFRYPQLQWPGTFRPFQDYRSHIDVLCVYTINRETRARVEDLEVIVQPTWRIASKQRSSTTREYLGAVMELDALREGRGEFDTEEAFYEFWRRYPFRIGRVVQQQLDKLLREQGASS